MLKLLISSFLNLLFILFLTRELKGLISFILNNYDRNISNYISGILETLFYYFLSLSIIFFIKILSIIDSKKPNYSIIIIRYNLLVFRYNSVLIYI